MVYIHKTDVPWPSYLFHLAQFVHTSLIPLHTVLCQVQMSRVTIQLFLILRHLLDHLWEVAHWRLVLRTHAFLLTELLQLLRHLSDGRSTTTTASWCCQHFQHWLASYHSFCDSLAISSLHDRRHKLSIDFFHKIFHPSSCLHHLLPDKDTTTKYIN